METYTTRLLSKKYLTKHILELRLEKPQNFEFHAGQFIQVKAPIGDTHIYRSYSISSTPSDEYLELCVKLYDTGVASQLFRMIEPGSELTFKGPAGRFTVEETDSDLYFVATGVGLAPIMGMIEDELSNKKNTQKIHLIFGVRYDTDIFWNDRLKALEKNHSNFTYSVTVSQPHDEWTGLRGRVTEHIPEDTSTIHAYLCGSMDMIKSVRDMLGQRGTDMRTVHFEIF